SHGLTESHPMRDTGLTTRHCGPSEMTVSLGIKSSLIPGITVSGGLPFRGRDRDPDTGESTGPKRPSDVSVAGSTFHRVCSPAGAGQISGASQQDRPEASAYTPPVLKGEKVA